MLKLLRFYIVALLIAVSLTGCTQKKEPPKEETSKEEAAEIQKPEEPEIVEEEKDSLWVNGIDYLSVENISVEENATIALVAANSESPYWKTVKKGASKAVEDLNSALGYSGKQKIKLSYDAPKKDNVIEQINIIDQFLDKAPHVLCIAFSDANACRTQIDMAKNNGIKVIGFDTADKNQMVDMMISTDNMAAASEAAGKMYEAIDYNGKVAVLVHNSLTKTGQMRKQAIVDEMTQKYNDKNIQFVDISYVAQDERSEAEILSELLESHPDLAGVICTDLVTTEAVIDYAKKLEEVNFKIVGFDTSEKIVSEVGNLLVGTVAQDPYHIGYATVVAAARSIAEMENEETIYTDYLWVDAENIKDEEVQKLITH